MESKLLTSKGILNFISGKEFSLSFKKEGDKVREYIDEISNKFEDKPDIIYTARQEHTVNVQYCDGKNGEDFIYGKIFDKSDGLITDKKKIALVVKFADCTPVILYDENKKVLAAVHSGWRGTYGRISEVAINKMINDFSSNPKDIYAYIGPSIDQDNYEVGRDVYDAFKNFKNRDELFYKKGEKFHLNMIKANLQILLENNIPRENIEVSEISTYNSDFLHSARRDKENYGLNSMMVMMK
ncbi:peptidoglycan editing factor PgeF [Peptoniphilus sp. MSJ-1]|uniref:Purine nucleoside phosphorylase n=1 Tax=Peptoniphilus ovalis TaxID=2841503 RepID=A0ABS6FHP6_9FIRM|nr:peptidoglycan editing factor PgeF [Peptoniphilus ovalis]MBU5668760.1 peptidoglycan editing factor PgeF [Peptoniphilus ovalis]